MSENSYGWGTLRCPRCGDEAYIKISLATLDECECDSCEEQFSVVDIQNIIDSWTPVIKWISTAPKFQGGERAQEDQETNPR